MARDLRESDRHIYERANGEIIVEYLSDRTATPVEFFYDDAADMQRDVDLFTRFLALPTEEEATV